MNRFGRGIKLLRVVLIFCFFGAYPVAAQTSKWLEDRPGTVLKYSGTLKIGDKDEKPVTKMVTVAPGYMDEKTKETWIVHDMTTEAAGKKKRAVRYYAVRKDGIYLVAEAKKPGKSPKLLDPAYMILPLPVEQGKTWSGTLKNKLKITLENTIQDKSVDISIMGKQVKAIHIKSTGSAKVFGMTTTLDKEYWFVPGIGTVREIQKQKIADTETLTKLELKEINSPEAK